jgi:peptide-methionine (S)-S-oxide reductase
MSEKAYFAAGCFWGVESAFMSLPGVLQTRVGYMNGKTDAPTYESVCSGQTGHAEALEITFDPQKITYRQLLALFWKLHDPTTLNRQGPDVGTQYRSAIFTSTPQQLEDAQGSLRVESASGRYSRPIVTQIEPAQTFYPAEDYHQQYFQKRGINPTCHSF